MSTLMNDTGPTACSTIRTAASGNIKQNVWSYSDVDGHYGWYLTGWFGYYDSIVIQSFRTGNDFTNTYAHEAAHVHGVADESDAQDIADFCT